MEKILVATDFSEPARNAVDYAAHLAKQTKAELILFNVFKLSIHASNSLASISSIENLVHKKEEQLAELAKEISHQYHIKVHWEISEDDTIFSLKTYTEKNPVDLVVMGIESNLIEYKLLGNTTTAAIRLLQFPLLVVPHDIYFKAIDKIMYACESDYLKDPHQLDILREILQAFDAQLEIFHVLTKDSEQVSDVKQEKMLDEILKDVNHNYRYVCSPKVGDGIEDGLEQFPADLLVMLPHKRGFFKSIFKKSQTSQMTVKTRVPLLAIP